MGARHVREARNLSKPEHFKMVREALGLTQAEMAKMLGYGSRVRVAELEAGTRKPSASVVRLLQAYLNGYQPPDWPRRPHSLRITVHESELVPPRPHHAPARPARGQQARAKAPGSLSVRHDPPRDGDNPPLPGAAPLAGRARDCARGT
jgi:DNA-binding XRE family transcriptional regulator